MPIRYTFNPLEGELNPISVELPAGSDTQIQFNNAGNFGADANLTFNSTTDICTAGGFNVSGSNIPANGIYLPSSNTLSLSTNSTSRISIDSSGYSTGIIGTLGQGLYQAQQLYRLNSGLAGSNVNTAQNILGVGVSLNGSTVYEFEGVFTFTKTSGTTSHSFGIGFGGTATLNNIYIQSIFSSSGSALPTNGTGFLGASTSAATFNGITGIAAATVSLSIRVKGTVSVNAAGTFIPQYTLSAAPGGAYTTTAGSYFKIAPLGASGSATSIGTWA